MQIQYVLNDGDFMARNKLPIVSNGSAISTRYLKPNTFEQATGPPGSLQI